MKNYQTKMTNNTVPLQREELSVDLVQQVRVPGCHSRVILLKTAAAQLREHLHPGWTQEHKQTLGYSGNSAEGSSHQRDCDL